MRTSEYTIGGSAWRWPGWALGVALTAFLCGCSDESNPLRSASFYPVKGKVTLPDGKPLATVKVVFTGPATSSATTESDGTFTVKGTQDGLPAGDYRVRLEVVEAKGTTKKPALAFPAKYLDEDSSGLSATVKPDGPNDFEFKLNNDAAAAGKQSAGRAK